MKLFPLFFRLRFVAFVLCGLALSLLSACSRHSKPASSLSEKDRTTLEKYEAIRAALAVDDIRGVKRAGADLQKFLKPTPEAPATPLDGPVGEIVDAPMLDKARTGFMTLSGSMIKLAEGVEGYYVMDSPVPEGAAWVQRTAKVENPYVGKPMRDLGAVRK